MKNGQSPIVKLDKLSFRYKTDEPHVLKNISFNLYKGEYLVILGENGSGKSTLGNIMAGLFNNFSGKIEMFQTLLNEKNRLKIINKIGLVFQNPESQFIGSTVENDLLFSLETMRYSPNSMLSKIIDISERIKIKNILFKKPSSLSGGQKQKVAFASTLITDPEVIIFDEPTSLLDKKGQSEIFRIIDQIRHDKNRTIIEITHDVERVIYADRILILNKGKLNFFGDLKTFFQNGFKILEKNPRLHLPFLCKLSLKLQNQKNPPNLFLNNEEMVNYLCQLKKSK